MNIAKCSACAKSFVGGVGVDAFSAGEGERCVTWYCSMDCANTAMFADAIREARDSESFWRREYERARAEADKLRDQQRGRRRS